VPLDTFAVDGLPVGAAVAAGGYAGAACGAAGGRRTGAMRT